MNKEHVRLLKLYAHQHETFDRFPSGNALDINLSFLHPVSTLIITIRATNDMNNEMPTISQDAQAAKYSSRALDLKTTATAEADAMGKGFFFYHGDGTNPNYDRQLPADAFHTDASDRPQGTVKVKSISLSLNGSERHSGLEKGIEADYLRERLLPMLHSNSSQKESARKGVLEDLAQQLEYGQSGSKNIFVYPFSLNPEGSNPSGAVNFSKVSHAKLQIHLEDARTGIADKSPLGIPTGGSTLPEEIDGLRVDVYALYYNWLQIKDGRALLSFA
jgi:hypothetical protein